jgi:hypothetical protein
MCLPTKRTLFQNWGLGMKIAWVRGWGRGCKKLQSVLQNPEFLMQELHNLDK